MAHADRIWPALSALRRGELPEPSGIDALVALARGEVQAPPPPLLPEAEDPLAAEWCAAYEAETLAPCPCLSKAERAQLRSSASRLHGAARFYGWFHRWRQRGPQWAASVPPTPASFAKHLTSVAAWAGPQLAAAERAQREQAQLVAAAERPAELQGRCEPPPGGFAAVVKLLAAKKAYGGEP